MRKNYPYYECRNIKNLKELLDYSIEKEPEKVAFFYTNKEKEIVSKKYIDYYNDVFYVSNYLAKNYKNTHIAIIGENSYNWLVLFLAIILSNNVAVLIDKDLDEENINKLLKISNTKNIFYSDSYCSFKKINKMGKLIENIDEYIEEGKTIKRNITLDSDRCAAIFFTSGTTGSNKAVMLSQRNMANNIYSAASLYKPDGNVLSVLPYHHSFGLITSVYAAFFYHSSIFINSSLKNLMKEIKIVKPQTLFLVPLFVETFYKQIWSLARKKKISHLLKFSIKLSNGLRYMGIDVRRKIFKSILDEFGGKLENIICGGAPLEKKYVKWFRCIGIQIFNGYGITECSPVVAVNRNHFYRDGSVGQVVRGGLIKIENGEIAFKSDSVMLGYYNDKKSTDEVIKNGWFYTGDLGYMDNDNFLYITGRKKNIIILSNGENISPEEIESVLGNDKGVCEVIVFSKNNKLVASIYPNEEYMGDQEYFDNLVYQYNKKMPKNRQIALVLLRTEEFPKNNNKKIVRSKVEESL